MRNLNFGEAGDPEEFAPTWYPGQMDLAGAATLDLRPGQTLRGTDMVVQATPTRRVRGTVLVSGAHADAIQVMVSSRDPGDYMTRPNTMVRLPKSAFQFRLAPGVYTLTAFFNNGAQMLSGMAQVDMGNADVDNVAIQVLPGAELPGRLRIEGTNDLSALAQSTVQVRLFPKDGAFVMSNAQPGRVGNDGTFTLNNVGPQTMNVTVTGLPAGYYVKAANYGQQDAKANDLAPAGSNDLLVIVVSPERRERGRHGAQPCGRSGGGRDCGAGAAARRAIRHAAIPDSAHSQMGRFNLKGVEPNDHTVFAWEDIEAGEYLDPDVLKAAENHGKALKLKESSQESLEIESIPAEDSPAPAGF